MGSQFGHYLQEKTLRVDRVAHWRKYCDTCSKELQVHHWRQRLQNDHLHKVSGYRCNLSRIVCSHLLYTRPYRRLFQHRYTERRSVFALISSNCKLVLQQLYFYTVNFTEIVNLNRRASTPTIKVQLLLSLSKC